MKTYEELKAMTTEDLVRYAMGLQDNVEAVNKEKEQYHEWWSASAKRLTALKASIENIARLA